MGPSEAGQAIFSNPINGAIAVEIDEINLAIIHHLKDGRKSYKEIASGLNVTVNTVKSRIGKLLKEGLLDIVGLVNPDTMPRHQVVIVGVKLATMDLVQKGEAFSKLKGVVSVSVVTGRFDLILVVFLKEGFELLEFYSEEVSRIEGVQSVETFVTYKNYNLKIPYIL